MGSGMEFHSPSFVPSAKDEENLKRHIMSSDPHAHDIRISYPVAGGGAFVTFLTCNSGRLLLRDIFQPWLVHAHL
jgi:hypothetical protein